MKPAPGKRLQTGHNERRLVAAPQSPARDVALPAFMSQQKAIPSLQCMPRATSSLQAFPAGCAKLLHYVDVDTMVRRSLQG